MLTTMMLKMMIIMTITITKQVDDRKLWLTYSCGGGDDVTTTQSTKICRCGDGDGVDGVGDDEGDDGRGDDGGDDNDDEDIWLNGIIRFNTFVDIFIQRQHNTKPTCTNYQLQM